MEPIPGSIANSLSRILIRRAIYLSRGPETPYARDNFAKEYNEDQEKINRMPPDIMTNP